MDDPRKAALEKWADANDDEVVEMTGELVDAFLAGYDAGHDVGWDGGERAAASQYDRTGSPRPFSSPDRSNL